jgi:Amt family ammonium transporter
MEPSALNSLQTAADTVWVLLSAVLVFWMCAGFALVESGFCRAKHCVHVLAMNYGVVAVSTLGFFALGFGLMFGNGNAWIGTTGFFPSFAGTSTAFKALEWATVPLAAKFLFQVVFADTAATIVSGTIAERGKFSAYMLFSILMVTVLYPIAGHWIWGGGWLASRAVPMQDFAGSTMVHSIGGWAALTGAVLLGPRIGKFAPDGTPRTMRPHNMSLATLGTLILWMGWFGFNAGSTLSAAPATIAHIATTTMLAACTGMTSAMLLSWAVQKKPDLGMLLNGTLAGLVAITAGCNAVSMVGALTIGLIAGALVFGSVFAVERCKIDDPVGAISVHLVNGIWGTLAVGLFATKGGSVGSFDGLLYGGGSALFITQLIGVLAVGAYLLVASTACWLLVKAIVGLRVSPIVELEGLDMAEHGLLAYELEDHHILDVETTLSGVSPSPNAVHVRRKTVVSV